MIKIEITPNQQRPITRSGTTKDGKEYVMQEQHAYIYLGGDYPTEFVINIPRGDQPYAAGLFTIDASSLRVGQFMRLEVARDIKLIPLDAKKA